MRFSKRLILFMLVFLAVFTVICTAFCYITQYEPSTLITCVFAFCGAEGGFLAGIKIFEPKQKKTEDDNNGYNNNYTGADSAGCGCHNGCTDTDDTRENHSGATRSD